MSDVFELIDRFLDEYPDHVELHWQRTKAQQRAAAGEQLHTAVADLVTAHERHRTITEGDA